MLGNVVGSFIQGLRADGPQREILGERQELACLTIQLCVVGRETMNIDLFVGSACGSAAVSPPGSALGVPLGVRQGVPLSL